MGLYTKIQNSDNYAKLSTFNRFDELFRYKVYNLRCEKKSLRSIAADTGISTATVRKILKDFNPEESTDQLALDI